MATGSKLLVRAFSFSLLLCLVITSCSGNSKPPADFSLSSTPTTITLVSGGAGQQISITATSINGFTGMVTVAVTGLPSGVTAQPAMLTLTPGTAQAVTITASAAAAAGVATLTLTGNSGALTHTATVMETISPPPPDFTLTISPTSQTIMAGTSGFPLSVTANALNAFSGTVTVAITGLPSGVIANPATLSLTPGAAQSTTLTAALTAPSASSTVTFTGTSGSLVHSASLALTLQAAQMTNAPDVTTYHYDVARDGLQPAGDHPDPRERQFRPVRQDRLRHYR